MVEMLHMDDIWFEFLEASCKRGIHGGVPVTVSEVRQVYQPNRNLCITVRRNVMFVLFGVGWQESVFKTAEHRHFMSLGQGAAQGLCVNLRASGVAGRKPVNYL